MTPGVKEFIIAVSNACGALRGRTKWLRSARLVTLTRVDTLRAFSQTLPERGSAPTRRYFTATRQWGCRLALGPLIVC